MVCCVLVARLSPSNRPNCLLLPLPCPCVAFFLSSFPLPLSFPRAIANSPSVASPAASKARKCLEARP